MTRRLGLSVATYLVLAASSCAAQNRKPTIVGIYSSLRYAEGAGDVLGTEIILSHTDNGYEVTYEHAEGAPGAVYRVPAIMQGDSLSFQLPPDTLRVMQGTKQVGVELQSHPRFRARISVRDLRGRFDGEQEDEILSKRSHSYWQK